MGAKHQRIDIRVDEQQMASIKNKASKYDMTVSELLLRSAEAYTQVYDDDLSNCTHVAISYSDWYQMGLTLTQILQAAGEVARQVAGMRHLMSTLEKDNVIDHGEYVHIDKLLSLYLDEVSVIRKDATRGLEVLGTLHEAACAAGCHGLIKLPVNRSASENG